MDPGEDMDLTALERAVRADVARERGARAWLRSRSPALRLVLALGFAMLLAVTVLVVRARGDLHTYPVWRMGLTLGWFGLAAGASAWLALRPVYLPRPSARLVIGLAAFALAGPLVTALLPAVPTDETLHAHRSALAGGCFTIGALAGVVTLLLARLLDRGGPHGPGPLVLAAAAAGLVGNVALQLHCPINFPAHLLLGHATVPMALVLATLLVRRLRA